MKLGISGFEWKDLNEAKGLKRLHESFSEYLKIENKELFTSYESYLKGAEVSPTDESDLMTNVGPFVTQFVVKLFGIEEEYSQIKNSDLNLKPVFLFKRDFVQRRVLKKYTSRDSIEGPELDVLESTVEALVNNSNFSLMPEESLAGFIVPFVNMEKRLKADKALEKNEYDELAKLAQHVSSFEKTLATPADDSNGSWYNFLQDVFAPVESWVAHLYFSGEHKDWASFQKPHPVDFDNLVPIDRPDKKNPLKIEGFDSNLRRRDGFKLTDNRMSQKLAMGEVDYCIYCHSREKDSCSKGLKDKKTQEMLKNPIGIKLSGCPLDEKISEAHLLRKEGDIIAALATVIVDNPMCPGTGHRICNDCMKSCIFQKQEPVNIPQIETNILTQVLSLPYGFEIYSLLTRWNPLNRERPFPVPYNGKNILVVGMGPAGYTLAHYLLNEGFGVVGIDGLKIEPLPERLTGDKNKLADPVKNIADVTEALDKRVLAGFGGVAEYGITVRWDKNFLKMIYLTMVRREKFSVYGGVRFGGTVSIEDAWELGFDHIAMATGAGKPTIVPMKNNLIRGVRKASDLLMALQLTGAFKENNMANLQVRLPAVVIGGGLTGIDTATELLAYYPIQVEKILTRYEILEKELGAEKVLERAFDEDKVILKEFLEHGKEVRVERKRAKEAGEEPNFVPLVRKWGGVTLVYRKTLNNSPAYRLNHEEITKALEEGISFVEQMSPVECHRGKFQELDGVTFEKQRLNEEGKWRGTGEFLKMEAKSLCVAAGTSPNTIYEREKPGTFEMDKWKYFFKNFKDEGGLTESKDGGAFFTSYDKDNKRISFYGDNHPDYAGNVVKAMASAKDGYPKVEALFKEEISALKESDQASCEENYKKFTNNLDEQFLAKVVEVKRLTPTIVEVVMHAPIAARNFHPGQFYRLQNFEADALEIDGTKLTTEGIALTGAWNDPEKGLLSVIILEMGTSSRLCGSLKKDQKVVLMGPTGAPTEIPKDETVLLLGGGLGNAVLFSIGDALEHNGCRVIYFAGYKHSSDIFKREEIEAGTDVVVWANDQGDPIKPNRPQDKSFTGNIVQAMIAYAEGKLGDVPIPLKEVDRMIVIGSDRMMAAVKEARFTVLKEHLKENHLAVGSINSSMQCMMKEVCAQCLQKHVDPKTGEETKPVFSCFNQDQDLDKVDFRNLNERLQMNHLQEILSGLWLDHLFKKQDVKRV